MDILPLDVTLDILARLPGESVSECKLVCATWRNLVSHHPSFPELHLYYQKLQTEEDGLSTTSTIDYSYPEEEYPSEFEEDNEEDPTPTEEHEEDEALIYTSTSGLSRGVSEWFDWWTVSDQKLEQFINSCTVSDAGRLEPRTWIHVYAYFNEKTLYGGYGVIVRNALGEPIIAAAMFSKVGNSFYYQVFKGINAGVALAEKHGCSQLHVRCNSIKLPSFYSHLHFCSSEECKATDDAANICDSCDKFIMSETSDCDMLLVKPLIVKLRHMKPIDFHYCSRGLSEHYPAKLEKKKILETDNKEERFSTDEDGSGEIEHVIEPANFSPRLKHIVWGEGFFMSGRRIGELLNGNY